MLLNIAKILVAAYLIVLTEQIGGKLSAILKYNSYTKVNLKCLITNKMSFKIKCIFVTLTLILVVNTLCNLILFEF